MIGRAPLSVLVVLPLLLRAGIASAVLSSSQEKCEQATASAVGKLAVARMKCVATCDQNLQTGSVPATDCAPPYGGTTATCITTATGKAAALINSKCGTTTCPPCYAGGDCASFQASRISAVGSVLDTQYYPTIFCPQSGLTEAEAKCREAAAQAAAKLAATVGKCYAKCHLTEFKKALLGTCVAPDPTDAKFINCKASAVQHAVSAIAVKCTTPPPCLAAAVATPAQSLNTLTEGLVDDFDAQTFCF